MRVFKKAILPLGFEANAVASGIKRSNKLDLGLIYSKENAIAVCMFTSNRIQAAPIKVNQKYLKKNKIYRAIIVNSGNANCFTGKAGLRDAEETTRYVGTALGIRRENVLVASTGIIGRKLPLKKIKKAIPGLVMGLSDRGIDKVANAIMTTDTRPKAITVKLNIGGCVVTICGIAKGSGMIAPDMRTMLGFIFTDAKITKGALDKALRISVSNSFNCITVDNCMSTNDMVSILANSLAANTLIDEARYFKPFLKALNIVCLELSKMIILDAEGATKFIRIKVDKAASYKEAKKAALAIANSNLFKTAIYGESPNFFGRVIAAIGSSGIDINEEKLKVKASPLNKKQINIDVSCGTGMASATVYTTDLTHQYIKINTEYN